MKKYILAVLLTFSVFGLCAQKQLDNENYRRSSLYSMLIAHPHRTFNHEIQDVFYQIPIPEKYDDHNLIVRSINTKEIVETRAIDRFLKKNQIARRMVAKWFNRDKETGAFSMNLISSRGQYDATYSDAEMAELSIRGTAMLSDAGEELIENTFLIVNDIRYIDKENTAKAASLIVRTLGVVANIASGGETDIMESAREFADMLETIKGFRVTVTSYLYQLEWNEETAAIFYESYYMTGNELDENRKMAFENDTVTFKLKYVGTQSVKSDETSIEGVDLETPEVMIRKVCTR